MITCIKCGCFISYDSSNLSSICQDCVGKLADNLSAKELITMAKVGLDAVIDEVTGYQKARPKDDLKRRYEKYRKQ